MLLKLKNEYRQKLEKHNVLISESKQLQEKYEKTKDNALHIKYLFKDEEIEVLEKELAKNKKKY